MKKIIFPISFLITGSMDAQLTQGENYIQSKTYLDYDASGHPTKTAETVQYFDGLGRPKQIVNVKASPNGKDVVTHIEYDAFGRQVLDFLPVPQTGTLNGGIVPSSLANASQPDIYGSEKIFSEKVLENSPLNRILAQKQVGNAWTDKPVSFGYDAVTVGDGVRKFTTVTTWESGATKSVLGENWLYTDGQLYKNSVTDEDGNKTIEFKNGRGQLILLRKVVNSTDNADTYYVYNEYNQLAFVLPPIAAMRGDIVPNTVKHDELCYQYRYDGRNRLVEKKVPGKGWEYMVYDKADRLILTQDANMRNSGSWYMTKYDQFGRVAYTGTLKDSSSRSNLQNQIANLIIYDARDQTGIVRNGITLYYTNVYFSVDTLLSVNYYDTYPQGYAFNPPFPSAILGEPVLTGNVADGKSTKGLPVMSFVKNIEDDKWTKNYSYYDTRGRVVGTYSINHLGGYTRTESKLDFAGVPLMTHTYHTRTADEAGVTVKERFVYDHQNRLKEHYHQVDNKPEELLSENTYNELSQLKNKKVGNNLQSIDYAYNIRGWLSDINKDQMAVPDLGGKLFSYKIKYTQKEGITNPDQVLFPGKDVKAKYNGNIAETDWRAVESLGANPSLTPKRYGYAYDSLNRLTAGYYQNPQNPYSKENIESLAYDLNGNVINLYRTSVMEYGNNTATVIDHLDYTYTGNQAVKIKDISGNKTGYEGTTGFPIDYDTNGNMTSMMDKQITGIGYNYLNLPNKISIGVDQITTQISTKYRADGVKLRKENVKSSVGFAGTDMTVQTTDYLDGFQYFKSVNSGGAGESSEMVMMSKHAFEPQAFTLIGIPDPTIDPQLGGGGTLTPAKTPDLQFFPTSEGFYDYAKNQYIYSYSDHLGNVRISFAKNSAGVLEIVDANDYYPFGMNHLKTGNAFYGTGSYKNYKFSGKELQETGMYDFGARLYMNDVVSWGVIDPLAETSRRWSTYTYAYNNPLRFIDPDGRENKDWIRKDGKWQYDEKVTTVEQAQQISGVDGFAKNGTIFSNVSVDGGAESAYAQLNEGGSISKLSSDEVGITSIPNMLSYSTWTAEEFPQITNNGGLARTDFDASTHDKKYADDKTFNLDWGSFVAPGTFPASGKNGNITWAGRLNAFSWAVDRVADLYNLNKGPDIDTASYTMGVFNYNSGKFKDTTITLQHSTKIDFSKSNAQKTGKVDSVSLSNLRRYFNKK